MKRSVVIAFIFLTGVAEVEALTFDKPITLNLKKIDHKEKQKLRNRLTHLISGKMIKHMEASALKEAAQICVQLGDLVDAVSYLDQFIVTTNSVTEQKEAKLQRADIYFERGILKKAADYYDDFQKLYPGDTNVTYAQYKGILSKYYCTLDEERDQTLTQQTINLCNSFIEHMHDGDYVDEVKTIRMQCYQRLLDHEMGVFEFYFKQGKFKAAETRLANIQKSYENKLAIVTPKVLHCTYRLAQAKGETKVAQEIMASLQEQYPSYFRDTIQYPIKKKVNYLTRF